MIAEELRPALRAVLRGEVQNRCGREPDFTKLYQVLGDAQAQEEIRQSNPGVRHCHMLRVNARACEENQENDGRVCPNNPWRDTGDPLHDGAVRGLRATSEWWPAIEELMSLENRVRLGAHSPQQLRPAEVLALRILHEERGSCERLFLARAIASEVSKLFGEPE